MSELALQLIAENKTKHARGEDARSLDLGRCGLTELPDLSDMGWLETLIISNEWWDYEQREWIKSQNTGPKNKIARSPARPLPVSLRKLILGGGRDDRWPIKNMRFMSNLTGLTTLNLRDNQIHDLRFLEKMTNLTVLNLSGNQIGSTRPLGELTSLKTLYIHNCEVNDRHFLKKLTNLTTLNLSNNQISDGRFLKKMTNLERLFLSRSLINDWRFLENLTCLTSLDLSATQISDWRFLENLTCLTSLDLSATQISDWRFLENLTCLTSLNISSNQISDWPFWGNLKRLTRLYLDSIHISDWRFLENLRDLTTLSLNSNHISDCSFLENLTSLTTLDLSRNQISNWYFLKKLTGLTTLNLRSNQINDARFLENLTGLTTLNLSSNQISDWHFLENLTGLTKIDISYNSIEDLSPLLYFIRDKSLDVVRKEWYFTGLGEINITGNPLTNPPIEIIEQGNKAILNYFKQIEEQGGTAPLYEAKLIIVGEPDAGKTTLFQILKDIQHPVPNPQDKTTTGVRVEEGWRFSHPKLPEGVEFSANLWDFGGQEIQYMTHQFFLTARSLYIILTDDRRENANMAYWFSAADLFGRDNTGRQSPILVALNSKEFKSASKFDFDLHRFQSDYEHLQIEERRFDFASSGGYGRGDLIDKVKDMLVNLPHVGTALPRRWPEVRESLREWGTRVNHIDESEFCRICTEKGISQKEDQFYLSHYLHDLGSILHFQNDPELRDFIILNPSWAVAAVYAILENKKVVEAEGMFDDPFLDEVWGEHYSRPEQSNLLRLMKRDRFEVCFELSGEQGKYLAPQLLSPSRPNFAWPKKGLLRFHFQYQFLPKGIVTRLHVRKHEMVAKDGDGKRLAWDKGAVFQQDGCRAVVEERELRDRRKIIEIEVEGPTKDRIFLLKLLRNEIEAIHKKWFSKVTFEQMVPCCCSECIGKEVPHYYKFTELLKYEQKKLKNIKCPLSEDLLEVPVSELLDGIFFHEELVEYREGADRQSGRNHHYHGTTYVLTDHSKIETKSMEENNKQGDTYNFNVSGGHIGNLGGQQGNVQQEAPQVMPIATPDNTSKKDQKMNKNYPLIALIGFLLIGGYAIYKVLNSPKGGEASMTKDGVSVKIAPEQSGNPAPALSANVYSVQIPIKINGETPNVEQIGFMRSTHTLSTADLTSDGVFTFRSLEIPNDKILIFELFYKNGKSAGLAQTSFASANINSNNSSAVLNTLHFNGNLDKKRNQYVHITVAPEFKVQNMNVNGDSNNASQEQK